VNLHLIPRWRWSRLVGANGAAGYYMYMLETNNSAFGRFDRVQASDVEQTAGSLQRGVTVTHCAVHCTCGSRSAYVIHGVVLRPRLKLPSSDTSVFIPDGSKNVPNFAMMYCSTVEFKQKEIAFLKSNHCWTVWEIMTIYAFVLTVKYAKEYRVSETYKITIKFNTSHCMRSISSHSN